MKVLSNEQKALGCVILTLFSFCLIAIVGQELVKASEADEIQRAFLECGNVSSEPLAKVQAYKHFIARFPQSDLADDALLEIAKIQIADGDSASALETLESICKEYPYSVMRRYIYLGDPDEEWLPIWKEYVQANPILTSDWARLLMADIHASRSELDKSEKILKQLLIVTKKPILPDRINPAITHTEDLRSAVLILGAYVAERSGNSEWLNEIQSLAREEYGVDGTQLRSGIPLMQISLIAGSKETRTGSRCKFRNFGTQETKDIMERSPASRDCPSPSQEVADPTNHEESRDNTQSSSREHSPNEKVRMDRETDDPKPLLIDRTKFTNILPWGIGIACGAVGSSFLLWIIRKRKREDRSHI